MTSELFNHLWQSTLFAGAAGLLVLALRNNRAQVRYWLWLIASLKFLIPFAVIVALGSYLAPTTAVPAASAGFSDVVTEIGQPFIAPSVSFPAVHPTTNPVPSILLAVWLCGFLVVAFRWYARWRRVRATVRAARPLLWGGLETRGHLVFPNLGHSFRGAALQGCHAAIRGGIPFLFVGQAHTSKPVRKPAWQAKCLLHWPFRKLSGIGLETRGRLPIGLPGSRIPLLSSPALLEPGIFGIFRPVLVMPEGIADHLSREQLQAILAHELCHVRRRDNLFAALHMAVEAIFWFHPLVWWIGARLVEERERACDEEVLRLGNEPEIYAESILKTCRFYLESPLACMSGVTGADLKKRIVRIMTQRVGHPIDFARKVLLAAAGVLAISGPFAFGLMNTPEALAQSPPGEKPKFEVASIKPDKSGGRNVMSMFYPGGRFHGENLTTRQLIELAYQLKPQQLIGGSKWIDSAHYDIQAKPPASFAAGISKLGRDGSKEELLMVQSLLADRFNLTLSRTTKDLPIYALVLAKHGLKLRPPGSTPLGASRMNRGIRIGRGQLTARNAPLSQLANVLSSLLGRVVVDKTGLKGVYDFTLKWTPERNQSRMYQGPEQRGSRAVGNPTPQETSGPSIFTALREQLGLRLKAEKGPVEVFVIDHVERPSAN